MLFSRRGVLLFLLLLLFFGTGCMAALTDEDAEATVQAGGCRPYGDQPQWERERLIPTCEPEPGTPTLTPRPTIPPTPRSNPHRRRVGAVGVWQEIGDQPGYLTHWQASVVNYRCQVGSFLA